MSFGKKMPVVEFWGWMQGVHTALPTLCALYVNDGLLYSGDWYDANA